MSIQELNNKVIHQLNQDLAISADPKTFCILPFSHLSTTTTGEVRLCCRSKKIDLIENNSLLQVWNSDKMDNIRTKLLQGQRPDACRKCWDIEDKGMTSLRHGQNCARTKDYQSNVKQYLAKEALELPTIELKLSNRCNLKCTMCSPAASNRWNRDWSTFKHLYDHGYQSWIDKVITKQNDQGFLDLFSENTLFNKEIKLIAANLKLVDFAGGEPLIDPLHYNFLEAIVKYGNPKETTLRYSTNLTVLSFEKFSILELWSQFKQIDLTISLDGYPELNDYIRKGSDSLKIKNNIKLVKGIANVKNLKCTTTISALNAPFIKEIIDYVVFDLQIPWHTSRVVSPDFLDARVWPKTMRTQFAKELELSHFKDNNLSAKANIQLERHINDFKLWMNDDSDLSHLESKFHEFIRLTPDKNHFNFYEKVKSKCSDCSAPLASLGVLP